MISNVALYIVPERIASHLPQCMFHEGIPCESMEDSVYSLLLFFLPLHADE